MFVTGIKMENAYHWSATRDYPLTIRHMVLLPAKDHAGSCCPRYAGSRVKKVAALWEKLSSVGTCFCGLGPSIEASFRVNQCFRARSFCCEWLILSSSAFNHSRRPTSLCTASLFCRCQAGASGSSPGVLPYPSSAWVTLNVGGGAAI